METHVDPSYREAVDRATEAAARRREDAAKRFGGNKLAGEQWLRAKSAQRQSRG